MMKCVYTHTNFVTSVLRARYTKITLGSLVTKGHMGYNGVTNAVPHFLVTFLSWP
jgi:hypothetical protein